MFGVPCGLSMRTKVLFLVLLLVAVAVAAVSPSAAVAAPMPYVVPIPVAPPRYVSAGSQYYELTLPGMRRYVDSLRERQPQVWLRVDPSLAALEAKARRAAWVGWGGLAAGIGLAVGGIFVARDLDPTVGVVMILASVPVMVGGFIGWAVMVPRRDDLLEVVNLHNQLAPAQPLQLSRQGGRGGPSFRGLRLTLATF
jgi:hypothetical protein